MNDKVLLKIYRTYSKSEAVQLLRQRIKELETEQGMLKSEIAELQHEIGTKNPLTSYQLNQLKTKGWVQDILKNERIIELEQQVRGLNERLRKSDRVKKLEKEVLFWREKACHLMAKYENPLKLKKEESK